MLAVLRPARTVSQAPPSGLWAVAAGQSAWQVRGMVKELYHTVILMSLVQTPTHQTWMLMTPVSLSPPNTLALDQGQDLDLLEPARGQRWERWERPRPPVERGWCVVRQD